AMWGPSGLETPLFAALNVATLIAADRGKLRWTVACALLATLTRPEGVLVAGVALAQLALARDRTWKQRIGPGAAYACGLLLLTLFRLAYYGVPVPNTFYAKVGGIPLSHGVYYVWHFFEVGPAILVFPALFAWRDPR